MSGLASVFGGGFDTSTVEPQDDFNVLPPGDYVVGIEKSEVKQTKKHDGHFLKLTMSILDGQFKNRKLWSNINIQNPSQKCVEIGLAQMSALGRATGVPVINSEDQFLGKTCIACVKVKDNQNEVRTYKPLGTASCIAAPVAPRQQYAPPTEKSSEQFASSAAGSAPPPWAR